MPRAVLLAPLLVLLAPLSSACSIVEAEPFSRVLWADDARAFTNGPGSTYGFRAIDGGGFEPVLTSFPLTRPALSPDASWIAWQEAQGLGAECSAQDGVVHARGPDGDVSVVQRRSATGLAAGATHLAVAPQGERFDAPDRAITLYPWGRWNEAREVEMPPTRVSRMAMDADGRWLLAHLPHEEEILVVDVASARVVATIDAPEDLGGFALAPDGARAAILDGRYGQSARVRVVELPSGNATAERRFEGNLAAVGVAWGAPGVAVALREMRYPGDGRVLTNATFHVLDAADLEAAARHGFPGATTAGSMAFTLDGRLIAEVDGALRVLGAPAGPEGARMQVPGLGAWAGVALAMAAAPARRLARRA